MDFEQVTTGHCLIEAPRWDGAQLWFTDILLGGIHCLRPDGRKPYFVGHVKKTRYGFLP